MGMGYLAIVASFTIFKNVVATSWSKRCPLDHFRTRPWPSLSTRGSTNQNFSGVNVVILSCLKIWWKKRKEIKKG